MANERREPCRICGRPFRLSSLLRHEATYRIFWTKVNKTDTCWLWTGGVSEYGYPRASHTTEVYGHRLVYRWMVGEIPSGYEVDHLCRVKTCVNPAHLEVVTPAENKRRGNVGVSGSFNREKTVCVHGHAFDAMNTAYRPDGRRSCRACNRDKARRYTERLAARQGVAA